MFSACSCSREGVEVIVRLGHPKCDSTRKYYGVIRMRAYVQIESRAGHENAVSQLLNAGFSAFLKELSKIREPIHQYEGIVGIIIKDLQQNGSEKC